MRAIRQFEAATDVRVIPAFSAPESILTAAGGGEMTRRIVTIDDFLEGLTPEELAMAGEMFRRQASAASFSPKLRHFIVVGTRWGQEPVATHVAVAPDAARSAWQTFVEETLYPDQVHPRGEWEKARDSGCPLDGIPEDWHERHPLPGEMPGATWAECLYLVEVPGEPL